MRLIVKLACGHVLPPEQVTEWPAPGAVAYCTEHQRKMLVAAIETREYHVTCNACRYGRWCGQSINTAKLLASRHELAHPFHIITVDFMRHPDTYEAFIKNYGKSRAVRWFINGPLFIMRSADKIAEDKPPF